MDVSTILFITELIGTVAFAVSGALVAIDRSLDFFGVVFIGCITAVGGGILRDVILGQVPPRAFLNLYILLIAAVASTVVFVVAYLFRSRYIEYRQKIEIINNVFDAIGLAAFAVMGTENAINAGFIDNAVFCISLGTVTCIGGGMLRDMMTNATPYVLKKHIYALAAIAGSWLYLVLSRTEANHLAATVGAMAVVFVIRMLATYFRWSLPRVFAEKKI